MAWIATHIPEWNWGSRIDNPPVVPEVGHPPFIQRGDHGGFDREGTSNKKKQAKISTFACFCYSTEPLHAEPVCSYRITLFEELSRERTPAALHGTAVSCSEAPSPMSRVIGTQASPPLFGRAGRMAPAAPFRSPPDGGSLNFC